MNVALVVVVLVLAFGGSVLLAIRGLGIGARRHHMQSAIASATAFEQRLTDALHADAERIAPDHRLDLYGRNWGGKWPEDLCAYPPCEPEDGWICTSHQTEQPSGRRNAPPMQSHGHDVITAKIHYLDDKRGAR